MTQYFYLQNYVLENEKTKRACSLLEVFSSKWVKQTPTETFSFKRSSKKSRVLSKQQRNLWRHFFLVRKTVSSTTLILDIFFIDRRWGAIKSLMLFGIIYIIKYLKSKTFVSILHLTTSLLWLKMYVIILLIPV